MDRNDIPRIANSKRRYFWIMCNSIGRWDMETLALTKIDTLGLCVFTPAGRKKHGYHAVKVKIKEME